MGYYYDIYICGELRIEKKQISKALGAARKANKQNYHGSKKIAADWTLGDHVKLWGYECYLDDPEAGKKSAVSLQEGAGMVGLLSPHMDLWRALAPFIAPTEDYIEFNGEEDYDFFRWYFVDGEIVEKRARVVWE